jgi:hypothetical protein
LDGRYGGYGRGTASATVAGFSPLGAIAYSGRANALSDSDLLVTVVPDRGGEREQALGYSADDASWAAYAVPFPVELVFDGVVDRFDPCRMPVIADHGRPHAAERRGQLGVVSGAGGSGPALPLAVDARLDLKTSSSIARASARRAGILKTPGIERPAVTRSYA